MRLVTHQLKRAITCSLCQRWTSTCVICRLLVWDLGLCPFVAAGVSEMVQQGITLDSFHFVTKGETKFIAKGYYSSDVHKHSGYDHLGRPFESQLPVQTRLDYVFDKMFQAQRGDQWIVDTKHSSIPVGLKPNGARWDTRWILTIDRPPFHFERLRHVKSVETRGVSIIRNRLQPSEGEESYIVRGWPASLSLALPGPGTPSADWANEARQYAGAPPEDLRPVMDNRMRARMPPLEFLRQYMGQVPVYEPTEEDERQERRRVALERLREMSRSPRPGEVNPDGTIRSMRVRVQDEMTEALHLHEMADRLTRKK